MLSLPIRAMEIHSKAGPFVIAAGALLGVSAGLLWTAHGSLILAYPAGSSSVYHESMRLQCNTEYQKGLYISICWSVFNMGAVIGAAVALGQNANSSANKVSKETYVRAPRVPH